MVDFLDDPEEEEEEEELDDPEEGRPARRSVGGGRVDLDPVDLDPVDLDGDDAALDAEEAGDLDAAADADGDPGVLDDRRREVVRLSLTGATAADIAHVLGVSLRTVYRDRRAAAENRAHYLVLAAEGAGELVGEHVLFLEGFRDLLLGKMAASEGDAARRWGELVLRTQRSIFAAQVTAGLVVRGRTGGGGVDEVDGVKLGTATRGELVELGVRLAREIDALTAGVDPGVLTGGA